jgi:hypothetical protein
MGLATVNGITQMLGAMVNERMAMLTGAKMETAIVDPAMENGITQMLGTTVLGRMAMPTDAKMEIVTADLVRESGRKWLQATINAVKAKPKTGPTMTVVLVMASGHLVP